MLFLRHSSIVSSVGPRLFFQRISIKIYTYTIRVTTKLIESSCWKISIETDFEMVIGSLVKLTSSFGD